MRNSRRFRIWERPEFDWNARPLFGEQRPKTIVFAPPAERAALRAIVHDADVIGFSREGHAFLLVRVSSKMLDYLETFEAETEDDEPDFEDHSVEWDGR